ncbi:four helix bundle protein (plasmid) [Pedobacter sp. BS3]|uniref:four helix bundle protein n=1 Tax=Pedobacter sp. BS3 TaxID=2567937 RepID=UPI0011EE7DCB|nr:four helix bundle protein [Pedobacter sp. BS3]TZF86185.1 four helix bundle protein [Pedobacter sp. BS3]
MYYRFEDMPVWQLAMDYAVKIHELTSRLPKSEDYGLTSQLRRAALSISSNLAEGFGRETAADKKNFYIMSRGSLLETSSQLMYGHQVGYFSQQEVEMLKLFCDKLHFSLNKLIKSFK